MLKAWKDVEIDIIDRLPTPFGLVRSGVAPDHPETKVRAPLLSSTKINGRVGNFLYLFLN